MPLTSKYRVVKRAEDWYAVESWVWWMPVWIDITNHPCMPRLTSLTNALGLIEKLKSRRQKSIVYEET